MFDTLMWPGVIEVVDIRLDHPIQLPLTDDHEVIQALAANTVDIPVR